MKRKTIKSPARKVGRPKKKVETVDATEELVESVEEKVDKMEMRTAAELMNVPYKDLTEAEKEYLISALAIKCNELDKIVKHNMENNRNIADNFNKDLDKIASTLTYIKDITRNFNISVDLAIKNIEREVGNYGN